MAAAGNRRRYELRVPVTGIVPGTDDANHVEVDVYYSKGGINYSNYKSEPMGYYASITGVKVSPPVGDGFGSVSFMMFGGRSFKVFLADGPRFNSPLLKRYAKAILTNAKAIADAIAASPDNAAAKALLLDAAATVAPVPYGGGPGPGVGYDGKRTAVAPAGVVVAS